MALNQQIKDALQGRDDLLKEEPLLNTPLAGHCYVASEVLFHMTGGYDQWYVERTNVGVPKPDGDYTWLTHWYLRDRDNQKVTDLTREQFTEHEEEIKIPYGEGTRTGFLTEEPSKRAQSVIEKLK